MNRTSERYKVEVFIILPADLITRGFHVQCRYRCVLCSRVPLQVVWFVSTRHGGVSGVLQRVWVRPQVTAGVLSLTGKG